MKKIQVPVMGGMRKVIQPGSNVTVGTTIAEVGSGTVTLAQLAAAITNIQQQNTNNGGGNIGSGSGGFLVLGPGLAGGGSLTGNVPIRLIAPIPWDGDGGGGSDGDPGPPGAAGPAGAAGGPGAVGPAGPAVFLEAEPGEDGLWAVPGPAGPQGVAGAVGATGPQGPSGSGSGSGGSGTLMFMVPEDNYADDQGFMPPLPTSLGPLVVNGLLSAYANMLVGTTATGGNGAINFLGLAPIISAVRNGANLTFNSTSLMTWTISGASAMTVNSNLAVAIAGVSAGNPALSVTANNGASNSQGIFVQGGTNANDYALFLQNSSGVQILKAFGDGGVVIGTATAVDKGLGTLNVQQEYYRKNVPLTAYVPGSLMLADETWTDEEIYRGPTNGPITVNGLLAVNGPPDLIAGQNHIIATGGTDTFSIQVGGGEVFFGSLSSSALGLFTNNSTRVAISATGAAVFNGTLSVKAATPTVTAAQTDIGTTTTAAVISTVGGIALPALASTFWVVNVNGVAYGIPCFAL